VTRVLVDSSAWVDFFNGHPSAERRVLSRLIRGAEDDLCTCGVVVAEVFQGLRRRKGRDEIAELFRNLTFLEAAGIDLHLRAAEVYRELRRRGRTIRSTIDCLIAVLAEEHGCWLLARDRDMEELVGSGLLDVRLWPATGEDRYRKPPCNPR
jgi:hypothetical protein